MSELNRKLKSYSFITYLAIAVIPILVLGMAFYYISYRSMLTNERQNAMFILELSVRNADGMIQSVYDGMNTMSTDEQLLSLLREMGGAAKMARSAYFTQSRRISMLLGRYFASVPSLFSACIITPDFTYTQHRQRMPDYGELKKLGFWQKAMDADGNVVWIPTYDYIQAMGLTALRGVDIDYRKLVTAVKEMRFQNYFEGYISLESGDGPPMLMLNFLPAAIGAPFEGAAGGIYGVFDPSGVMIAASKELPFGYDDIKGISGASIAELSGARYLVCTQRMSTTGWLAVQAIPIRGILGTVSLMPNLILVLLLALAGIAFFVAKRYNHMNERIMRIVRDNHNREMQAREAEIKALNVQLNPHFLYNTLGSFHYMALQNGDRTLSRLIMSMCNMLRYTSRQCSELVPLREDIAWLRNYLMIMEARQDGRFHAEIDIPDELGDMRVPKLFLQPFVENALLHGFSEMGDDYRIDIRGDLCGARAVFTVADNGRGMSPGKADALLRGEGEGEGIRNVVRRLALAYGGRASLSIESTEGAGTRVRIELPCES